MLFSSKLPHQLGGVIFDSNLWVGAQPSACPVRVERAGMSSLQTHAVKALQAARRRPHVDSVLTQPVVGTDTGASSQPGGKPTGRPHAASRRSRSSCTTLSLPCGTRRPGEGRNRSQHVEVRIRSATHGGTATHRAGGAGSRRRASRLAAAATTGVAVQLFWRRLCRATAALVHARHRSASPASPKGLRLPVETYQPGVSSSQTRLVAAVRQPCWKSSRTVAPKVEASEAKLPSVDARQAAA